MDAKAIIEKIRTAEKKTPVKAYIRTTRPLHFENCHVFTGADMIVMGDYKDIAPVLERNEDAIEDLVVRVRPTQQRAAAGGYQNPACAHRAGAIIRDEVEIGEGAVIMMGAILNIGTAVGEGTMIDMGAVLGGRAIVGRHSHIGAGTVLAGVVEPPSAKPVTIGRQRAHRRKRGGHRGRKRRKRRGGRSGRGRHAGRAGKRGGCGRTGTHRQDEGRKDRGKNGAHRRAAGAVNIGARKTRGAREPLFGFARAESEKNV